MVDEWLINNPDFLEGTSSEQFEVQSHRNYPVDDFDGVHCSKPSPCLHRMK